MVATRDVQDMLSSYLDRFPEEWCRLQRLSSLLTNDVDVTVEKEARGHLTASAVVLHESGNVLLVERLVTGAWGLPSTHLEPGDASVADAALRAVACEVGIPAAELTLRSRHPVHIRAHLVPVPAESRVLHTHFDVRFVVRAATDVGALSPAIGGAGWFPSVRLPDDVLRHRALNLVTA